MGGRSGRFAQHDETDLSAAEMENKGKKAENKNGRKESRAWRRMLGCWRDVVVGMMYVKK